MGRTETVGLNSRLWHGALLCAFLLAGSLGFASQVDGAALDPAFGTGGRALVSFPNAGVVELSDIEVLGDGGSVAVGGANPNGEWDFAVARLDGNGLPSAGFGAAGRLLLDLADTDIAQSVAVQGDGRLVVAGFSSEGGAEAIGLARLGPDGAPDPSLDGDGVLRSTFGFAAAEAVDVAVLPDGRILLLAEVGESSPESTESTALLRLGANGELDAGFGEGGVVELPFEGSAISLAQDKVVVAGNDRDQFPSPVAVARYDSAGLPDPSFGGDGVVDTPVDAEVQDVLVEADGRIVVGGGAFMLIAYRPDGSLDGTFGTGGIAASQPPQQDAAILNLAQAPGGGYFAAAGGTVLCIGPIGSTAPCGFSTSLTAARFAPNGLLDQSFGSGGMFAASAEQNGTFELSRAVAADGQGLLLAGEAPPYMAVLRVLPDASEAIPIRRRVVRCRGAALRRARPYRPRPPRARRQRRKAVGVRLVLNGPALIRVRRARVVYRRAGKRRAANVASKGLRRRWLKVGRRTVLRFRLRRRLAHTLRSGRRVALRLVLVVRSRSGRCPGRIRARRGVRTQVVWVHRRAGAVTRRG